MSPPPPPPPPPAASAVAGLNGDDDFFGERQYYSYNPVEEVQQTHYTTANTASMPLEPPTTYSDLITTKAAIIDPNNVLEGLDFNEDAGCDQEGAHQPNLPPIANLYNSERFNNIPEDLPGACAGGVGVVVGGVINGSDQSSPPDFTELRPVPNSFNYAEDKSLMFTALTNVDQGVT